MKVSLDGMSIAFIPRYLVENESDSLVHHTVVLLVRQM